MIPLALITGFLGAGKTTYLANLARRYGPRRVAFLINEFANVDLDSPQVSPQAELVIGVSGGSIFCRCKATEYINRLTGIANAFPDLDGVVIEASGMANPAVARSMLEESGLDRYFSWAGCICLADPGSLLKVLDTLAAAERQVAVADVVLLNKCDLHPETALAACESAIRDINPQARIQRTVQAACDLDPLALASQRWFDGELALCADPAVIAIETALSFQMDRLRLEQAVAELGDGLLRAKGFMETSDGWRTFDWAGGTTTWRDGQSGPAALVLLVRPSAADQARQIVARLTATRS